jgi:lipid A 3-O-deacylase
MASARADDLGPAGTELRIGVLKGNVESVGSEDGTNINAELLFASPFGRRDHGLWSSILEPRLHIGTSQNIDGYTSQYYAGLTWDFELGYGVFAETSFGGTVHDGPLNDPKLDSFGCVASFRESVSLGYHITDRVSVMAMVDHFSNANLCERNRGLTNAGVRLGYALD